MHNTLQPDLCAFVAAGILSAKQNSRFVSLLTLGIFTSHHACNHFFCKTATDKYIVSWAFFNRTQTKRTVPLNMSFMVASLSLACMVRTCYNLQLMHLNYIVLDEVIHLKSLDSWVQLYKDALHGREEERLTTYYSALLEMVRDRSV